MSLARADLACKFKHFYATLVSIVREIFDESAYERFLKREKLTYGDKTYAAFLREQGELKGRRPKCC
jgi:hypothetical protein